MMLMALMMMMMRMMTNVLVFGFLVLESKPIWVLMGFFLLSMMMTTMTMKTVMTMVGSSNHHCLMLSRSCDGDGHKMK